jgi:type II restriction/modification system DNA methylase subunit YeeA
VDRALSKQGIMTKAVERWKEEMPVEQEMVPKDKYTIFDRKEKKYRKSIRSKFLWNEEFNVAEMLTMLQSCQNGQECHNESILLVTDRMS